MKKSISRVILFAWFFAILGFQNCSRFEAGSVESSLSLSSTTKASPIFPTEGEIQDVVFHYSFPFSVLPDRPQMWIRHVGPNFLNTKVNISNASALTGINAPLIGATTSDFSQGTPTFMQKEGNEYGFYFNTRELHQTKVTMNLSGTSVTAPLIPFDQRYCKVVGLGAPQFTLGHEIPGKNIHPWLDKNSVLEMSADIKVPHSIVRGALPPVFISSFYIYLNDDSHPGSVIAFLANLFDYRGQPEGGIGNDNHVYFLTTPLANETPIYASIAGKVDSAGNPVVEKVANSNELYETTGERLQSAPFSEYRNFSFRISYSQMVRMIQAFKKSLGTNLSLSDKPEDYRLGSYGLLNEMNYHYQIPASNCVPNFDENSYAETGMAFRNFNIQKLEIKKDAVYNGGFEGIFNGNTISGWACEVESADSVQVRLQSGSGVLATVSANLASEYAVYSDQCKSASKAHRFIYNITEAQKSLFAGQTLDAVIVVDGVEVHKIKKYPEYRYTVVGVSNQTNACQLPSGFGSLAHGASRVFYSAASVNFPSSCDTVKVAYGCNNGQLIVSGQGTPASATCSVITPPPASIVYKGYLDGFSGDTINGWACQVSQVGTVSVRISDDVGNTLFDVPANAVADDQVAIANICGGVNGNSRFQATVTSAMKNQFGGREITAKVMVNGAAVFTLPKGSGLAYQIPRGVLASVPCSLPNGFGTLADGATRALFTTSSVTSPATCESMKINYLCSNGSLSRSGASGSPLATSCIVQQPVNVVEKLQLKRYYWINTSFTPAYTGHRVTTQTPESFYTLEAMMGSIYKTQQPSAIPLYECLSANNPYHYFLAVSSTCFGGINKGLLGYISQQKQVGQREIFLCYVNGVVNGVQTPLSHFVTTDTNCEGQGKDGSLGFVDL